MSNSRAEIIKRRNAILEELKINGRVCVTELSKLFNVSTVTIRHDLDILAQEGNLIRMNGGATCIQKDADGFFPPFNSEIKNLKEKQSIAKTIFRIIKDGSTIFINSGTTSQLIAKEFKTRKNLSIVTNSIEVANILGGVPSFRVILLGGEINTNYRFTYGSDCQEQLSRYRSDITILSIHGIEANNGITTCKAEEAINNRIMMNNTSQIIVAADHTKIGRTGFSNVCNNQMLENLHLVTDKQLNNSHIDALEKKGVKITSTPTIY